MDVKDKDAFLKILPEFCQTVDPMTLIIDLPCLSQTDREQIMNSQTGALHGSTSLAAQLLHSALIRRQQGFREIVLALRKNGRDDLADKMDPGHNIN
ncbi:hypothetical protein MAR_014872 [Mya arenaria]|uniref:Caspase recruitment domain-containing protein n=1 Tax=Mya arenaria TaxID=6604 RepID=A0ABY7FFE0_MYAAR|nr:hypothetical protein MAR_014872 [Mya arenaria]